MKKRFHENRNQKKTWIARLISEKTTTTTTKL